MQVSTLKKVFFQDIIGHTQSADKGIGHSPRRPPRLRRIRTRLRILAPAQPQQPRISKSNSPDPIQVPISPNAPTPHDNIRMAHLIRPHGRSVRRVVVHDFLPKPGEGGDDAAEVTAHVVLGGGEDSLAGICEEAGRREGR